ncbi:cytochrome c [Aliiroseovarius sp. S1339]|uniref:c-type cytochrome n=1 Tax=Aliiroseovarius sp. S1339 TaxID=2936990 RepID=UPI0020BDF6B7|nr:cytochrome c [Aliiroseovarius sp. S1339]MCK8464570.1 cytochrome c [Aliiroseovarius sp. S1339]
MNFVKTTLLAMAFSAPLAAPLLAHEDAKNPVVIERMKTMKAIGDGMKTLSEMSKGEAPFDAAIADASVAIMAEKGVLIPAKFEANETDPATEALPAIWENFEDFVKKSEDMVMIASSMGPIGDEAALGAALGQIGGTCKACHRDYRK